MSDLWSSAICGYASASPLRSNEAMPSPNPPANHSDPSKIFQQRFCGEPGQADRSLTTGSKGAGFVAALCFMAILKFPVPSFSMKTLEEEGTIPGGVCTAPRPA